MTITLDLAPEIERGLLAQAQAQGVSITDFVERLVEREARQAMQRGSAQKSLVQFFRESPLVGLELDFEREREPDRDIPL